MWRRKSTRCRHRGQRRLSPRGFKVSRSPMLRLGRARTPTSSPAAISEAPNGGRPAASMREREMSSTDGDGGSPGRYRERRGGESELHPKVPIAGGNHAGGEAQAVKIAPRDALRRRLIIEDWEDESPILVRPMEDTETVGETMKKGKRLIKKEAASDGPKVASARKAVAHKKKTASDRPSNPTGTARKKKGLPDLHWERRLELGRRPIRLIRRQLRPKIRRPRWSPKWRRSPLRPKGCLLPKGRLRKRMSSVL
ncbi:unnamed protein product [Linum trigynum]|uniref:Uncharacterized protein n=1 Tax=Linum trigynum TaxID=586398 RepID=A0AAV2EP31_9ROSI